MVKGGSLDGIGWFEKLGQCAGPAPAVLERKNGGTFETTTPQSI